jgi:hypothetical protein
MGELELVGDDAIALAGRTEVSIGIMPNFCDDQKNEYGEVIDHVAICVNPVVSRQNEWRLLLSNGGQEDERIYLTMSATNKEPDMAVDSTKVHTFLTSLCGKPSTDDNYEGLMKDHLIQHAAHMKDKADTAKEGAAMLTRATAAEAKLAELEKFKPITLSREARDETVGLLGERVDLLVEKAKVTPACAAKLKATLAKADPILLTKGETEPSVARQIIDILSENDPVKLGEQSKSQTSTELTRKHPGSETVDEQTKSGISFVEQQRIALGQKKA